MEINALILFILLYRVRCYIVRQQGLINGVRLGSHRVWDRSIVSRGSPQRVDRSLRSQVTGGTNRAQHTGFQGLEGM